METLERERYEEADDMAEEGVWCVELENDL